MASDAPIISIFYARFHDEHGRKVLHQVPEGSIIPCPPSPTAIKEPYIDFYSISSYLIPYREFCNRSLSICSNGYRILGHPICITDPAKYERNDFIFNFCIVLNEKADWIPFKGVITKLAKLFANLEEQDSFLSKEEQDATIIMAGTEGYGGEKGSKVFAVVEMVFEDLQSFGETMIPVDESNTLSLSLFPARASPPPVYMHHVPLSVVRFDSLQTSAWDLTIQRILPHINGINSVDRISQITDTDPRLARRAVQHLVYYDCVLLLDIFSFSAIYAPTPALSSFVESVAMQDECRSYVHNVDSPFGHGGARKPASHHSDKGPSPSISRPSSRVGLKRQSLISATSDTDTGATKRRSHHGHDSTPAVKTAIEPQMPSRMQLIDLYASFRQGVSVKEYCIHHNAQLRYIDVRRLVTFGVIKGLLYRVHKYALRTGGTANAAPTGTVVTTGTKEQHGTGQRIAARAAAATAKALAADHDSADEEAWRTAAQTSGWRPPAARTFSHGLDARPTQEDGKLVPPSTGDGGSTEAGSSSMGTSSAQRKIVERENKEVLRFADGLSCFDEIGLELKMVEAKALERIKFAANGAEVVVIAK